MVYDNASDTKPVSVVGRDWLWIYDVATTKGAELLQVSAASGKVVNTVSMPSPYAPGPSWRRTMMAFGSDP